MKLTCSLHEAGVVLVAGTDSPNLLLVPGFSLHDELAVLTDDVGRWSTCAMLCCCSWLVTASV